MSEVDSLASLDDESSDSFPEISKDGDGSAQTNGKESSEDQDKILAQEETRAVSRLRSVVIAVLVVSTTAVAMGVHFYLKNAEENHFRDTFTTDADKVVNNIAEGFTRMMAATDALTVNIVSHARDTNQTFPFVVLPDFGVQATKARKLAPTLYYSVSYKVSNENRAAYEDFTVTHDAWVSETLRTQALDDTFFGVTPTIDSFDIKKRIRGYAGDMPENSPKGYLPSWQISPLVPGWAPYNWDYFTLLDHSGLDAVLDGKKSILTKSYHLPDPNSPEEVAENIESVYWYATFVGQEQDPSEPVAEMLYPILSNAGEFVRVDEDSSTTVGLISMAFYWASTLRDVLLPGKVGLIVVFDNPCNPSFTYRIDGPNATYIGRGDLHDHDYDYMEMKVNMVNTTIFKNFEELYTGVPLNKEFCPTTIRIYPSATMQDVFMTNNPIVFTIIAAIVFLSTSGVFLVYDVLLERRQRTVMKTAAQSKNLVSSLFPKNVHDRLLNDAEANEELMHIEAPSKKRLRSFLNTGDEACEMNQLDNDALLVYKTKPIADLFLETTIMVSSIFFESIRHNNGLLLTFNCNTNLFVFRCQFADLVGFTAWSSSREPEQVFMLLETIYRSFDEIAYVHFEHDSTESRLSPSHSSHLFPPLSHRRRVFKVETVGDCYVAVTGLPDPRKDHAVVMARFAYDCMARMHTLVKRLEEHLGLDTGDLTMVCKKSFPLKTRNRCSLPT